MTNPGSKEPALEPCPLAHPIKEGLNLWSSSAGRKWHIWCHDCGLQFEGRYEQPKEEMIKAWNTRISTDSAGAMVGRPKIICLCGSTRFIEQFAITTWELEREGFIVLGCTLLPMWYCKVPSHFGEATGTKEQCDKLHLRKIDLADEVLVLNIGGYIGESTANEIAYATRIGKPVKYIESDTAAASPALPRDEATQVELVDEVQHRMDQVVEADVEWHNAGRKGTEWFEAAEKLGAAINSLLDLRGIAPVVSDCDPDD